MFEHYWNIIFLEFVIESNTIIDFFHDRLSDNITLKLIPYCQRPVNFQRFGYVRRANISDIVKIKMQFSQRTVNFQRIGYVRGPDVSDFVLPKMQFL